MRLSNNTVNGAIKNALLPCALILALSGCGGSAALTSGLASGLTDKRLPPALRTPGAVVTNDWSYERDGELVTKSGQWVHLPAAEAGELLLWIEQAEAGR
ncbi:MAG: hypothetical protein ACLU98_05520 [Desulfovibrio fairfieldensis]